MTQIDHLWKIMILLLFPKIIFLILMFNVRVSWKSSREPTSLTSNQNSAAVVRIAGAAPVFLTVFHGSRGGNGVVRLLEEAFGGLLVIFAPLQPVLQPHPFRLLVVPDIHAVFLW